MILLWNVYLVPHKSCVWGLEISPTDTLPIALAKQGPCVLDGSCPSGTCFQSRNLSKNGILVCSRYRDDMGMWNYVVLGEVRSSWRFRSRLHRS